MLISIVMLIFLLFSDMILGEGTALGNAPVKENQPETIGLRGLKS